MVRPQVTLEELTRLLKQRFGSVDQVERFRTELQTRKRRPGKDLRSLAYPGPNTVVIDIVGHDAFLEALGDPR